MAQALPLVLAAAGTGMQVYNQGKTAERQIAEQERGRQQQLIKQREADQRTRAEIERVGASTPEDERAKANQQFLAQLRRTRNSATDTSGTGSARFSEDVSNAAKDVDQFGVNRAGNMAAIAAPGRQRQTEGQGFNRLAGDIDMIRRQSEGDDFLTQLRTMNIRKDPWLDAVGGIAQGAAGGMAAGGYGMTPKNPRAVKGTPAYNRNNFGY